MLGNGLGGGLGIQRAAFTAERELGLSPNWGFELWGHHFGVPNNKDNSLLGSTLGFPHLRKLPAAGKLLRNVPLAIFFLCSTVTMYTIDTTNPA